MMTDQEFDDWCKRNPISLEARREIEEIRSSQPARRVESTTYSMAVRYSSGKMGFVIQSESDKIEFLIAVEFEYDKRVLEFYDQPRKLKLRFMDLNERNRAYMYTADYFVIWVDGAGWVECKDERALQKLSVDSPTRFTKADNGEWIYIPGQEYANRMGLRFIVRSSDSIDYNKCRNLLFLEEYYGERKDNPEESE